MAKKPKAVPNYLVFISHSTKDRWIARQMAALIEQKGRRHNVKVFLDDRDIEAGDPIDEIIRQRLQQCDEFVVLLSPYSIDSRWVLMEIGGAFFSEKPKRIVVIVDQLTPKEIPLILAPYKALDINDFDEFLDQLIARATGAKK